MYLFWEGHRFLQNLHRRFVLCIKVHIFWEGHKIFAKSPPYFWLQYIRSKVRGKFCKILWPSQNIWTLPKLFWNSVLEICKTMWWQQIILSELWNYVFDLNFKLYCLISLKQPNYNLLFAHICVNNFVVYCKVIKLNFIWKQTHWNVSYWLWQYRLWSFKSGDTKLHRKIFI